MMELKRTRDLVWQMNGGKFCCAVPGPGEPIVEADNLEDLRAFLATWDITIRPGEKPDQVAVGLVKRT